MRAILAMAAALVLTAPVLASGECGPDLPADMTGAYCEMLNIKGDFTANPSRYQANGECSVYHGPYPKHCKTKWVAEGAYDQTTKAAWETITVGPRHRPYGRYSTSGKCHEDPWIRAGLYYCYPERGPNTGNATLGRALQPFHTVLQTPAQHRALLAEKGRLGRAARDHPGTSLKDAQAQTPRIDTRALLKDQSTAPPRIISPAAGSTHRPLAAVNIRIAPPKIYEPANFKVKTYELEWQIQQKDGSWKPASTALVPAAEAEGPGFLGWGAQQPGTPGLMTATVGVWRVRAMIKEPWSPDSNSASSEYLEFTIAGAPVTAEHARLPAGQYRSSVKNAPVEGVAGSGAASPQPAKTQPQSSAQTGIKHDAAALNPQPLPPKSSPAAPPQSRMRNWNTAPSTFDR